MEIIISVLIIIVVIHCLLLSFNYHEMTTQILMEAYHDIGETKRMLPNGIHNIEMPDGSKRIEYWQDGNLHRTDGPAEIHMDKNKWYNPFAKQEMSETWWIYGERFDINKFLKDHDFTSVTDDVILLIQLKYEK